MKTEQIDQEHSKPLSTRAMKHPVVTLSEGLVRLDHELLITINHHAFATKEKPLRKRKQPQSLKTDKPYFVNGPLRQPLPDSFTSDNGRKQMAVTRKMKFASHRIISRFLEHLT